MSRTRFVLHINAFSFACEGGYLAEPIPGGEGKWRKVGDRFSAAAAFAYLAAHPETPCQPLKV